MIRVRVYEDGKLHDGDESLLTRGGVKWVDVLEPDEPTLTRLGEKFGLHRLAIDLSNACASGRPAFAQVE